MSSLVRYSAIATKIRAMESRLLREEDYRILVAMDSVPQAVAYLKKTPAYEAVLRDKEEAQLHRGDIERLMVGTLYHDFSKLYRFCDQGQKKLLKLYFSRFEITVMKRAFRRVFNHGDRTAEEKGFRAALQKYTDIPLEDLAQAETMPEVLAALKGTHYYKALQKLEHAEGATLFDYEMTLDLYYFSMIWKQKNKLLKGREQELLTKSLGSRIDLLNMTWIYRAKKYYQLTEAYIYTLLIPVTYKLHDSDIRKMVTASDEKALEDAVEATYYGRHFLEPESCELEELYFQLIGRIYGMEKRKNPYSLAVLVSYLYEKEQEIEKLTTVLEGVRYQIAPEGTLKYAGLQRDGKTR